MRPRKKLQPQRKPIYFLASVALHVVLAGLLIYFYSTREQGKVEEAADPPAPAADKGQAVAREDSAWDPGTTPSSSPSRRPKSAEDEKIKALLEALDEDVLIDMPPTLAPLSQDDAALPSPSQRESSTQAEPEVDRSPETPPPHPALEKPASPAPRAGPSHPARAETPPEEKFASSPAPLERGVIRAQFTSAVEQHEPVDRLEETILADKYRVKRLYYFTEVKNMMGETIIHRWEYEGQVIAEVPLSIDSHQWRTYSSKDLTPAMTGDWQVIVTDEEGRPLHSDSFMYVAP